MSRVNSTSPQLEFALPPPDTNGILHARLAEVVEQFNESIDPSERVELFREMQRLRAILSPKGGAS